MVKKTKITFNQVVGGSNPPCLTTVYAGSIEKSMFLAFSLYSAMVTFARFWLPGEFENKNRIEHCV